MLILSTTVLVGCGGFGAGPDEATRRFDAAFWQVWFLHMDDADRKAVCWDTPEEAARDYAAAFDTGYVPDDDRAEVLFRRACKGLYP